MLEPITAVFSGVANGAIAGAISPKMLSKY
jgi:hypothetical protein